MCVCVFLGPSQCVNIARHVFNYVCVVYSMVIDISYSPLLISLSFLVSVAKQVTVHSVAGDVSSVCSSFLSISLSTID